MVPSFIAKVHGRESPSSPAAMLTRSGSRGGISVCSDRDKDGGRNLSIVPGRSEQSLVEFGLRLIPGALMSQFMAEGKGHDRLGGMGALDWSKSDFPLYCSFTDVFGSEISAMKPGRSYRMAQSCDQPLKRHDADRRPPAEMCRLPLSATPVSDALF